MRESKYRVKLTENERDYLNDVGHKGKSSVRKVKRALALVKADEGLSDAKIAEALSISVPTVARLRKRFVVEGMDRALNERPRGGRTRKLSGKQEARLVAVACSEAPEGYTHWTLRLLAGKVVELGYAESISPETVRQILKKTN